MISEKDAQALLEHITPQASSNDLSQDIDDDRKPDSNSHDDTEVSYELMSLSSHNYLCSIPITPPPAPDNQTANELAKAEEARELVRATMHGWELLSELGDHCLYFMSGWWSYKFCENREIVQFHAAAATKPNQAPKKDPNTIEYVLGAVPSIPTTSLQTSRQDPDSKPLPAELQVKGDQRYLVQKLEGGTICDLTNRERTIEVQYHCVPGLKQDRISWIKEVTICAYLMVVNTPRLCEDVAFLPPQEAKANPISCQLIVDENITPPLLGQEKSQTDNAADVSEQEQTSNDQIPLKDPPVKKEPVVVGGVVVGARNVLSSGDEAGKPPVKLSPPASNLKAHSVQYEPIIEIVAQAASKADGGKVEVIPQEKMEIMEIDREELEEMKAEIEALAGDEGWRLEMIEYPGDDYRELRGYVGKEEPEGKGAKRKGEKEDEQGSEEKFYKEEL